MVLKCSRFVAVDRIKRRKMGQTPKTENLVILGLAKGLGEFSTRQRANCLIFQDRRFQPLTHSSAFNYRLQCAAVTCLCSWHPWQNACDRWNGLIGMVTEGP